MSATARTRAAYRLALLVVLAIAGYSLVYRPSPMPRPFLRRVVRHQRSSSATWQERFAVEAPIARFHVHTYLSGSVSDLRVDLDGEQDRWFLKQTPIPEGHLRFTCGRDVPPGDYTLRVFEEDVIGTYVMEIGPRPAISACACRTTASASYSREQVAPLPLVHRA